MSRILRAATLVTLLPILMLTAATGLGASRPASAAGAVTVESDALVTQLVDKLNAERASRGVRLLTASEEARGVAVERAVDMATNKYFAHVSPLGIGPEELLDQIGVTYTRIGENIARSSYASDQVIDAVHRALMASPGHRENMLHAAYTRVGIAIVSSDGVFYAVQIFLD